MSVARLVTAAIPPMQTAPKPMRYCHSGVEGAVVRRVYQFTRSDQNERQDDGELGHRASAPGALYVPRRDLSAILISRRQRVRSGPCSEVPPRL